MTPKPDSSLQGIEIPNEFRIWAQNYSQDYARNNFTVLDYESNYALLLDVTFNGLIAAYKHLHPSESPSSIEGEEKVQECKSPDGLVVGLIDSLIAISNVLTTDDFLYRDGVWDALSDLRASDNMKRLMNIGELEAAKDILREKDQEINNLLKVISEFTHRFKNESPSPALPIKEEEKEHGEEVPYGMEVKPWDSIRLIGKPRDRFDELIEKGYDWHSFYHAWLEGRSEMLKEVLLDNSTIRDKAFADLSAARKRISELESAYHASIQEGRQIVAQNESLCEERDRYRVSWEEREKVIRELEAKVKELQEWHDSHI